MPALSDLKRKTNFLVSPGKNYTWSGIKVKTLHPLGFSGGNLLEKPPPVIPDGSCAIVAHRQEAFGFFTSHGLKSETGSNANYMPARSDAVDPTCRLATEI